MLSPMGVGPPAFTPPEPGPAPPQLEFTLPTPNMENVPETGRVALGHVFVCVYGGGGGRLKIHL